MAQRLAPGCQYCRVYKGMHKPSWAPAQASGDFVRASCHHKQRLLWLHCSQLQLQLKVSFLLPTLGLNGPQFYRWAEAKEAEVTDIWTKKCQGIHRGSITLPLRTGFTTVIVYIWKAPHPNSPCEWVKRLRSHLWFFLKVFFCHSVAQDCSGIQNAYFLHLSSRWKC